MTKTAAKIKKEKKPVKPKKTKNASAVKTKKGYIFIHGYS